MVSSFYILERTMREVLEIRGRSCRIQEYLSSRIWPFPHSTPSCIFVSSASLSKEAVQFGANRVPWQHHFLGENAITGRSSGVQAYIHLIYILSTANSDAQS
ncbi:hypothetical protein NC651_028509 [Populus alba x Populus x berolinensis]|nr:hypothetical protein NC651_028509 [Populus alba x Populus x berolinensis]